MSTIPEGTLSLHGNDLTVAFSNRQDAEAAMEVIGRGMSTKDKPEGVTDEIARYASRCREMSEGGKYEWWSRLAEILEADLPSGVGVKPDYVFDPAEWEYTCEWSDRAIITDEIPLGGVTRLSTLIKGPDKWVAHVPVSWGGEGDPDETEVQWFDSEAAARAALEAKP